MKTVQYIRISTKDQSNWSIEGQVQINTEFAARYELNLAKSFIDDGQSGKDFERKKWRELEKYIQACFKVDPVQVIVVTRFNRFARNAGEGLAMMERLDQKFGVRIMSALENVQVSIHSPFYFKVMADLLVNADFERRVIRDQCKQGIWRANSSGRYVNRAPYGYFNGRDENNKPVIQIDESCADIVRSAFLDYASGLSLIETSQRARERGWKTKGKSAMRKMLTNPLYAGKVKVPAYHEREATVAKGIHEPITDIHTFKACQVRFKVGKADTRRVDHPVFALRGVLRCAYCGDTFTGNLSKGKNKHYAYYRCLTCQNCNHQVGNTHAMLNAVLSQLSLEAATIAQIEAKARTIVETRLSGSEARTTEIERLYREQEKMMESAEEKFIKGTLTEATYQKWVSRIKETLVDMSMERELLKGNLANAWVRFAEALPLLTELGDLFDRITSAQKKQLVMAVFEGELYLDHYGFRTPNVVPVLAPKSHNINRLKIGMPPIPQVELTASPQRGGNGSSHEHFLSVIASLRAA